MPEFIPGRELSRRFYLEAVRPVLDERFPDLPHAAGLLGPGSDVLGFDTEMSTDHSWGPSVQIFLREEDEGLSQDIVSRLSTDLPQTFLGYSVNFVDAPDEPGTLLMEPSPEGPVRHRAFPTTVRAFVLKRLGYDVARPPDPADWLTFPSQTLLSITSGAVHHDGTGEIAAIRERFAYYQHDVWLYLLAAGWQRIGQEEHLMPRAGYAGDELGSALIGSRLVRDIMSVCFLMERQYAPYPKWFGSAFKQLECAECLSPSIWRAERAETWQDREGALCEAYQVLARMHNDLGITEKLPEAVSGFHGRPFRVINGERFAQAIVSQITLPDLKRLATRPLIGGIDQFSDSTDLRTYPEWRAALRKLYE